jgi:hypothetical protein
MNFLDETRNNGWVKIRRNVLAHLVDGRMTVAEYWTHHYLLMSASSSNGETKTCAQVIADLYDWKTRKAQRALESLVDNHYIESDYTSGKRGIYRVRVLRYEMTTGPNAGQFTVPSKPMRDADVVNRWHEHDADVTPTVTLTMTLTEQAQHTNKSSSYKQAVSDSDADDDADDDADVVNRWHEHDADVTPIQEGEGKKGEGKKDSSLLVSVDAGTPSPAPLKLVQEESAPVQTSRPAADKTPAQRRAERFAKRPTTPAQTSKASPAKPEEFHSLDFAFERTEDWNGYSPRRLQQIMAYCWHGDNDRYWRKADLSSEARLAKAIATMDKQTPADQKVPGWLTMVLDDADPACTVCEGEGYTEQRHSGYSGVDVGFVESVPCSCMRPGTKPWRKEYCED